MFLFFNQLVFFVKLIFHKSDLLLRQHIQLKFRYEY
jgi:hypothetical protein